MKAAARLWRGYSLLYVLGLYLPIFFVVLFAFADGTSISFPITGYTTKWFIQMAGSPQLLEALWNSISVASSAAFVSTIVGMMAAKAMVRARLPGRSVLTGLLSLPLVVPGIVTGISLLVLASSAGIELSLNTIRGAHILYCIPFAMLVMIPRLEGLDRSLEEASQDLGEGHFTTFLRVTLPLAAPGLLASFLLTFTVSLDEFVLAFFLAGSETTLPIYIWSQLRFPAKLPGVLALATCMLTFSSILVVAAEMLRRTGSAAGRSANG